MREATTDGTGLVEVYDPVSRQFETVAQMDRSRTNLTVTLLPDGESESHEGVHLGLVIARQALA